MTQRFLTLKISKCLLVNGFIVSDSSIRYKRAKEHKILEELKEGNEYKLYL